MGKWLESTISIYEKQLLELGFQVAPCDPGAAIVGTPQSKVSRAAQCIGSTAGGASQPFPRWRFFSSMM